MRDVKSALEIQASCQARGWQSCFIGGIVGPRWGEPRRTVGWLSAFALGEGGAGRGPAGPAYGIGFRVTSR
jgi:hypothetical protein